MTDPFITITLAVMAAVVVVLALGLGSFGRGGADGAKRSNRMMKWRLALQFVAIVLIVILIWIRTQGGQ